VEGSRIHETYKRVYYRDVQALLVVKRNRFLIDARLWLLPFVLAIAVAMLPLEWRGIGALLTFLILPGVLIYLFVAASFHGCRLFLATAVGNVAVTSVFRLWQARRFHDRVEPMIAAAQQSMATPPPLAPPMSTE
jgi:hypothetical protein